jgi:methylenetetrahydrofolate dehydrogenase (NADP+)/methenyltetrahydrofolate cyclohydrolase
MTSSAVAQILDGKLVSAEVLDQVQQEITVLQHKNAVIPKLAVVLVGDDPASQVYVNKKAKTAQKIGMLSELILLPGDTTQETLCAEIQRLNADESVHGILVQLPLPKHIDTQTIIQLVDPRKDVDGLHPLNLGGVLTGDPDACRPCTPAGVMTLLRRYSVPIAGKQAVVLGRSNIVGKPMGLLLLEQNATVTYCHSRTANLGDILRQADILVAAVGVPRMVKAEHVKPGAVVVDVGINRVDGKICGDVDFEAVVEKASFITPVPKGVGPMTIATLMSNTLKMYYRQQSGR